MIIINPAHILKKAIDYFTRYVFIKISYRRLALKKAYTIIRIYPFRVAADLNSAGNFAIDDRLL